MNILDYAKYPTPEEWDEIFLIKKESFDKIKIEFIHKSSLNLFEFLEGYFGMQLNSFLQEFNNRVFDLANNYVMLMSYFNAGIPDDEWFISPGKNGESVQYFPHFEEKNYCHAYWFGFYMESFYTRYSGIIDIIIHLINVKYHFEVEPSLGFTNQVLTKLKSDDKELYNYLKKIIKNPTYEKMNNIRNNLVHNYRPHQIDSGFVKKKNPDGSITYTMSVGKYTPSSEFVKNIEDSIDLLGDITETVNKKLSQ